MKSGVPRPRPVVSPGEHRPAEPMLMHSGSPFFSLTQSTPTLPGGAANRGRRLERAAVSVRTRQLRQLVPTRKRQPRSLSPHQMYEVNGSDGSQLMRDAVPTPAARLAGKQVHRDEGLAQTRAWRKGGASSCAGARAATGRRGQVHQAQPLVWGGSCTRRTRLHRESRGPEDCDSGYPPARTCPPGTEPA